MTDAFFEAPVLNSPYKYPALHWELDETRQPTNRVLELRRPASYITPPADQGGGVLGVRVHVSLRGTGTTGDAATPSPGGSLHSTTADGTHRPQLWAEDFFTVQTLTFKTLYGGPAPEEPQDTPLPSTGGYIASTPSRVLRVVTTNAGGNAP